LRDRVSYFLDKATELDEAIAVRVRHIQDLEIELRNARWLRRPALRIEIWREISNLLDAAYWQRESHNARLLDRPAETPAARSRRPFWRRLLFKSPLDATIAFLVLPDSTVTVCYRWLSLTIHLSSAGRYQLRREVGQWHRLLPQSATETQDAILRGIATALKLNDIAASLPRYVRRLQILPDDALHGAPFAAFELPGDELTPLYWCDRFSLSLGFQPERRPRRRQRGPHEPLIAGVSRGTARLRPLIRTLVQIAWVLRWFESRGHRAVCLEDEAATVAAVSTCLRTATFLHVSCHGDFVQDNPEETGLLLAGPDGEQTLSLLRVSGMDLSRLQHATLIACWAADNFIVPGRWILSLPEALWRAGTGSILASLWEVEEDVAQEFVKLFYGHLAVDRPDVALRKAQRQMRASSGKHRVPQAWAGFQLYGDARRLRL
jgi:CHAT domain-containing protein